MGIKCVAEVVRGSLFSGVKLSDRCKESWGAYVESFLDPFVRSQMPGYHQGSLTRLMQRDEGHSHLHLA
jgi:hypothetical protein